jgi:hypothetical protein
MSIMYISHVDKANSVVVETLADSLSAMTVDSAENSVANTLAKYAAIEKAAEKKEGFNTSTAQTNARGQIDSQNSANAVQDTLTSYEKLMQLANMGESVTIPAKLDVKNTINISNTNLKGNQNKLIFGDKSEKAADGSGEVYASANNLNINGVGEKGKPRVLNLNDNVNVGTSIDAPLVRINGVNAFDFTSDGALRINPAGTKAYKNVRVDSGLSANGSITGNTLCVGDSTNCISRDNITSLNKIPSLSSKIDGQYLTMDQAVKKSTKDLENNLGTKCSALNRVITSSGSLQVPGTDLYMAPVSGRHGGGNAYNGGRALVHDGGNVLTLNYNNDFAGVNVQSSANITGNLNVGRRIYFSDSMMRNYPDWWANGSDPYYLEKVTNGGNNSALRLTINDDGDESFQIWGNACAIGNCGGQGHLCHAFWANGDAWHGRNVSANHFITRSDERLKENIKKLDAEEMLKKIKRMDGYKYKLKADQKDHYGVIAQYIEKEFPEMVSEDKDGMKSVDYSQLVPVLMSTVKLVNEKADTTASKLDKALKA